MKENKTVYLEKLVIVKTQTVKEKNRKYNFKPHYAFNPDDLKDLFLVLFCSE